MKENVNEIKNEAIEEIIQRCEIITIVANRLTELRLTHNFTLLELEVEVEYAVQYAMEIKGVLIDSNYELFNDIKEHFFTLFDRFPNR